MKLPRFERDVRAPVASYPRLNAPMLDPRAGGIAGAAFAAAGGAARDLLLAKTTTGAGLLALGAWLYHAGVITGAGPAAPGMRRVLEESGWQAESVRVGGKYYAFRGIDPLPSIFLSMAATVGELTAHVDEDAVGQYVTAGALALAKAFTNASYMQSVSDALDALTSDDGREWQRFLRNRAASVVPALSADIARQLDPVRREIDSIAAAMKAKIPGLSATLPPRRNLKGEPVYYEGSAGPDMLSPFFAKTVTGDPVYRELIANQVGLSPVQDFLGGSRPGEGPLAQERVTWGVKLTPQEHDRYAELAGNGMKDPATGKGLWDTLTDLVQSPAYQEQSPGPDGGRALLLRSTVRAFREAARAQVLEEFPALQRRIEAHLFARHQALQPAGAAIIESLMR